MNAVATSKEKQRILRLTKKGVVRAIQREFEKQGFPFSLDEIEEMWTDRSNSIGKTWLRLPPKKNLFDEILLWWDRELTTGNSKLIDRSYFAQLNLFVKGF